MTTVKHPPGDLTELLAQSDVWQDAGIWRPIDGMPLHRALRLLGWLENRVGALVTEQIITNEETHYDHFGDASLGDVVAAEVALEETNRAITADPHAWLRDRPFYKAVLAQVADRLGVVIVRREAPKRTATQAYHAAMQAAHAQREALR